MDSSSSTPLQTLDDVDRECEKIVEEITLLEEKLRGLRTRRNQLVSISRLPVETLADIFLFAQKLTVLHDESSAEVTATIASVCSFWRQISLSTPTLWNHIYFCNSHWLECCLERSKGLPLIADVCLGRSDWDFSYIDDGDYQTMATLITTLFRSLPRIKFFSFDEPLLSSPLGDVHWESAEYLETLCLLSLDLSKVFRQAGVRMPALQTLALHGCDLDWDRMPISHSLKNLHIDDPSSGPHLHISQFLLSYLRRVPSLETLELEDALPEEVELPDFQDNRVPLLHLQRLSATALGRFGTQNLFRGITFPKSTRIYITTGEFVETTAWLLETLSAVASCRSASWNPSTLTVLMGERLITLKVYEDANTDEDSPNFYCDFRHLNGPQFLEPVCNTLDLTDLTILNISLQFIDHAETIPPTLWSQIFGHLPRLQVLRARKLAAGALVAHLYEEANAITTGQPFSFQSLEVLGLEHRYFYDPEHLLAALKIRMNHDHRLQKLIFYIPGQEDTYGVRDGEILKFSGVADTVEQISHPGF